MDENRDVGGHTQVLLYATASGREYRSAGMVSFQIASGMAAIYRRHDKPQIADVIILVAAIA